MAPPEPENSVSDWFDKFTNFVYDPRSGLRGNFDRLASHRRWGRKLQNKRWSECQTFCFTALYGGNADKNKLEKWQDLCREVRIVDLPGSIGGCKKVRQTLITGDAMFMRVQALGSRNVLVNLVNLIDHRSIGVPVIRFESYRAFHVYTMDGCTYPRKAAKEEGFIKALLRKV